MTDENGQRLVVRNGYHPFIEAVAKDSVLPPHPGPPSTIDIISPPPPPAPIIKRRNGKNLQLIISSIGCKYGRSGDCIFCNYGYDAHYSDEEKIHSLKRILREEKEGIELLIIGSFGNYFDLSEVSWYLFTSINALLKKADIPSIAFESHCNTMYGKHLPEIKQAFSQSNTRIIIEMGLESSNPFILKEYINKSLDINKFSNTIKLIKKYDLYVCANVILGTPYLKTREQLDDAYSTIQWAFSNEVDAVVVFPLNIKKETLVYKLYKEGKYTQISHWLLIKLLTMVDSALLPKIELAWVGIRQSQGIDLHAIPPRACSICKEKLLDFYKNYNLNKGGDYRKHILNELMKSSNDCKCFKSLEI